MKKTLLFVLSFFFAIIGKADITVGENQTWWGYFNEADADNLPYDGHLGYSSKITIDAAIKIPASEEMVSGATIKAVRLWLGNDVSAISSAMRVWISTSLPTQGSIRADYRQTVSRNNIKSGLNEVELETPFEINHQDIYVGYTISISRKSYPVMAYGSDMPNSFFYRVTSGTSYGAWNDFYGYNYGRLALQILVESESFPTNCVTVEDFGETILAKGEKKSIPITISNKGANPVKSIAYTITSDDGEPSEETSKTFAAMTTNGTKTIDITFEAAEEAGQSQKVVTVTKVNGEPNTAVANSGKGFIITVNEKLSITPVIEEFTGTWCGWCPRGTVGMEKVHEAYGDQVVQIAAHYSDPMAIDAYSSVINTYTSGFPNSITDRQFEADPSFSSLKSALNQSFDRVAIAAIDLEAEWESADQKSVIFNTTTRFASTGYNDKYAIAFVLTEDGMSGTGSDWAQQNYYSGSGQGGDMAWWSSQGSSVTGVKYNHVAVAGWSVLNGVNNSIDPNIDSSTPQKYSYTGSISNNSLIQDKSNLKAIALLIDRSSGKIVNAAQSNIVFATAIEQVKGASTSEQEVYDLSGRKLPTTQKGINLIRTDEGFMKKVLVK